MAAPIQVVTNADTFVRNFKANGGGGRKDFYSGRDDAFREHRDRLVAQVRKIAGSQSAFRASSVAVASVDLVPEALAKSNRPKSLFHANELPLVGTDKPAELLVQVDVASLGKLAERIAKAPTKLQRKERVDRKTGEVTQVEVVPELRSDVGAIDSITLWGPSRKLVLPLEDMVSWYREPGTPLALIVRLFEFATAAAKAAAGKELRRLLEDRALGECPHEMQEGEGEEDPEQVLVIRAPSKTDLKGWLSQLPQIVSALSESFIVRSIHLPARLVRSAARPARAASSKMKPRLPERHAKLRYPVVGVIDGGVADVLDEWVVYRDDFIRKEDGSPKHGTGIGSLLVAGQTLNPTGICSELDGCDLVDLRLMPKDTRQGQPDLIRQYYGEYPAMFKKLEEVVAKAKQETGARIFNFSHNFATPVSASIPYCDETKRLDAIARKHDVLFVISAGNLATGSHREKWPEDPVKALSLLTFAQEDRIATPAESLANVSVTAVNPPGVSGYVAGGVAEYARRGPSPYGGLKPDVAHYGGCVGSPSGLLAIDSSGNLDHVYGTSYAAPLVAKTLARYLHSIDGDVSRELLIALLVHHAKVPDVLLQSPISDHAKDLVGFGIPLPADQALAGVASSATLVFESHIVKGKRLEFSFAWPRSLIVNGKCRGRGRLTLVARPTISSRNGDEFSRTQLDAHVNQLGKNGKSKGGAFASVGIPKSIAGKSKLREANLRRHQLKWGPIKVYEFEAKEGVGETSQWRLLVESLERTEGEIPKEGIHFAALLTIEDIEGKAPVFEELKLEVGQRGASLASIRTALKARAATSPQKK